MRIIRYLQTGYLLHLISIFSVFMVFWLGNLFVRELTLKTLSLRLFLSGYGSGYFFTLIFFSQLDARSRFQNYKLTKDKLYEYGFDIRLLRPFVYSRCQRDAIAVAACEMNFGNEWKN